MSIGDKQIIFTLFVIFVSNSLIEGPPFPCKEVCIYLWYLQN